MFGHAYLGARYFGPAYFGPAVASGGNSGGAAWVPFEAGPKVTMGEPQGLPPHEQRRRAGVKAAFERLERQVREEDDVLAVMIL